MKLKKDSSVQEDLRKTRVTLDNADKSMGPMAEIDGDLPEMARMAGMLLGYLGREAAAMAGKNEQLAYGLLLEIVKEGMMQRTGIGISGQWSGYLDLFYTPRG